MGSVCSSCKTEEKFVYLGCADTIVRNWKAKLGPHLLKSDRIVQNRTLPFKVRHNRPNSDTIVGNHCSVLLSLTFYLSLFSRFFFPLFKLIADPRGEGIGDSVEDEVAMDTSSVNSEGTETEPAVQPQVG